EHFCSGFDLSERGGGDKPRVGATQRRMRWQVNRLIPTMLETQTPIVAAARGWVIGLGLHLLLASDFAVVADDARVRAPFAAMGFTPDSGGSWLLPRLAGVARAKEMLMLVRAVGGVGDLATCVPGGRGGGRRRRVGRRARLGAHRRRRPLEVADPPGPGPRPGAPPPRRPPRNRARPPF